MSIGAGIVLIVIGAILAFAVNVDVEFLNLDLIGYILMGAGVVVVIIGIALLARRRTATSVTRTSADPTGRERVTERSVSADDDPRI
ncbi:MAG: DUF6458 family protein [Microbacterium sp.]|uniref:DUF6458 family protein n=1 Tax=Microbacterium sp. TaxID=51671 RepID=UPI002611E5FD|nr:DUF6458 family protein [Microbacterium sp.]MCX6502768.1 DUF6458 family protein [Microbacterium sp.]